MINEATALCRVLDLGLLGCPSVLERGLKMTERALRVKSGPGDSVDGFESCGGVLGGCSRQRLGRTGLRWILMQYEDEDGSPA
jgi:hypothetical protein